MEQIPSVPRYTVLRWGLLSEGFLIAISIPFVDLGQIQFSLEGVLVGVLATLPLLAFNFMIFGISTANRQSPLIFEKFKREIIRPLCGDLNPPIALTVAIASGIGEELFFRGLLTPKLAPLISIQLGVILSSAIFAYVHFIGVARQYARIVWYYFLFGLYFSILALAGWGLVPAMICHALYNLLAMLYVRYWDIPNSNSI